MPVLKDVPLSALDPRYKELLLRGAREAFEVTCETPAQAYRLQSIVCSFRNRMKQELGPTKSQEWEPLYGCIVGIRYEPDPKTGKKRRTKVVTFRPRANEFDSVLASVAPKPTTPTFEDDPLEALLNETKGLENK